MDLSSDANVEPTLPRVYGQAIICVKCQAHNDPQATQCSRCKAALLPGRRLSLRAGYVLGAAILAAALIALAGLQQSRADVLPRWASPVFLFLVACGVVLMGLRMALVRTPLYERYLMRAQRHVERFPEQALADLTEALEWAPVSQKAGIRKQRGDLYTRLGRKEQALRDLSAHSAVPRDAVGARLASTLPELDMEGQAGMASSVELEKLQHDLVQEGLRKWVGYCTRCKDAALLTADRRCVRCERAAKDARLIVPAAFEEELADLNAKHTGGRRRRWRSVLVTTALLLAVFLIVSNGIWTPRIPRLDTVVRSAARKLNPYTRAAGMATFSDDIVAFQYPADWELVPEDQVPDLLETPLQGLPWGSYEYIGGVYTKGLEDREGCAKMLIVAVKDTSLRGTLTDEQYEALRQSAVERMGSRLISHFKTEVCSMPAAELIHIGASQQSRLWQVIIVPPWPGQAYIFTCCSHPDSYAEFEPVFERAMQTLRIGEPVPVVVPTVVQGDTYAVQAGDTLSKIAGRFGVTLESLIEANGIDDPSLIRVGQVLVIPVPQP